MLLRHVASIVCAGLIVFPISSSGQNYGTRINVTAIEVSATVRDANGNLPSDLKPGDFELIEDGKRQRIIGVTYSHGASAVTTATKESIGTTPSKPQLPWQVVIYLQQSLSATEGLRLAIKSLIPQVDRLVAMGDVEVITDDPSTHSLLGPTRDAAALRSLFETLGNEARGREKLIRIRQEFMTGDRNTSDKDDRLTRRSLMRKAARQESTILRAQQDAMFGWLSRYARHASGDSMRTLVFVTDGFDLAPAGFYSIDRGDIRPDLPTELRELNASIHQNEIAQALAAQGWTVLSYATSPIETRVTHFAAATHEPLVPHSFNVRENVGHTIINKDPLAPLKLLADATGGSVLTDPSEIGVRLDALDQRVVITYQVDRPSDDKLRHVEIRAVRAGLTINAQKWVGTRSTLAAMPVMAELLATELATSTTRGEDVDRGELPVTCSIKLGSLAKGVRTSEIEVRVNVAPIEGELASLESGTLRFTVAVVVPHENPFTSTNRLDQLDFSSKQGFATTITVRHRDGAKMAVIAEEPSTGAWGGCTIGGDRGSFP
ncbi:MAG TPA: hypothetical protein VNN25_16625 [Thermoanaerobaculia bacterium]|nr:hypothetical protein [Thermoanaerobaculia bacterium]